MTEEKFPYVGEQLDRDVKFLMRESPDYIVDMGLLAHVIFARRWKGNEYEYWTDVPVAALAKKSKMGYLRVKESIDRLEEWGIIVGMETNNKMKFQMAKKAPMYMYPIRSENNKAARRVKKEAPAETLVRPTKPVKKAEPISEWQKHINQLRDEELAKQEASKRKTS